jgi:outer membrane lipoprotein-sorting protein
MLFSYYISKIKKEVFKLKKETIKYIIRAIKIILFILIVIFLLSSCKKENLSNPDINEVLLSIKNYSCSMSISIYSNKNSTTYVANQVYSYPSTYSMEFIDPDGIKILYSGSSLNIKSGRFNIDKTIENYDNINQNPLFLSYFLNSYFSVEKNDNIIVDSNSVNLILPENNPYLVSAKLVLENGIPKSLTYFDKNGTEKVNIIYNEFKLNRA